MTKKKETESSETPESFSTALAELEAILRRIDGDEIDIDRLADELRRADVLLRACREKIRKAEVEVHQIVEQLAEGREGDEGD